jgi:outer membrane protein
MRRPFLRPTRCFALLWIVFGVAAALPSPSFALSIDEALAQAKQYLPTLKASQFKEQSSDALYKASFSPYFPSLDAASSNQRFYATPTDYNQSTYDVTLSYLLFDGGKSMATKDIAKSNLAYSGQGVTKTLLDLEFSVKAAFYNAMARSVILEQRHVQLKDAKKDYEVAQGRHKLGAAKLSDVLQASVRLEQSRYNIVQAEGSLSKSIAELNSLLGRPLETAYDLQGALDYEFRLPDRNLLSRTAMERPEIKQAEISVKISQSNVTLQTSPFYPTISTNGSYSRAQGGLLGTYNYNDSSVGLFATWNILELGKFFKRKAAKVDIKFSEENLKETVRLVMVDVSKAYDDVITALKNTVVAREQLKAADQNYAQAFGEYKVGKGDILSLVVAESSLARAQEQLTLSQLDLQVSKALLERTVGIEKLETLNPS